MSRQLHLNLFIHARGHHEAAWRHPAASQLPLTDIRHYAELARKAEAGRFDSVVLADTLAVGDDVTRAPRTWLAAASGNYGREVPLSHAERYQRAEELC